MRRLLSILLWILKTVLLIVALAALVLWPVSCGRYVAVSAERYTAGPASGGWRRYTAACWDGRAVFRRGWQDASDRRGLAWIRWEVRSYGEGWRWERWAKADGWNEGHWPARWGPLRWDFSDYNGPDRTLRRRAVAAPLWGIALAAGVWPVASITLAIRRRRRLRRAARAGLCKKCGYDLRATPQAGGALLAVCPECGAEH